MFHFSKAHLDDFVCDSHRASLVSEVCRIPCPNDCVLSEWSEWSTCSLPCTGGKEDEGAKMRNRTLLAIAGPGQECFELMEKTTDCNPYSCAPVHWTTGEWGPCLPVGEGRSAPLSCGPGVRRREVTCSENGVTKPMKRCKFLRKPETEMPCNISCPEDCAMTNFSDWTPCRADCNTDGVQYKKRFIIQSPKHGGKSCPGALVEERLCTRALETTCLRLQNSAKPAYRWNVSTWSECLIAAKNQPCGMGFQMRTIPWSQVLPHCHSNVYDQLFPSELNELLEIRIAQNSSRRGSSAPYVINRMAVKMVASVLRTH
ncbi:thrombospondin type-1 domain-containing protein 7B [Trichonephila clavipes]|nr:thrombospondin type-1 domain-containing protein 7B [Trichonephila clavipes]